MSKTIIVDTPENWDLASKGYSEKVAPLLMASFAKEFVDLLEVSKDMEVVEVAAGSGALTLELAKHVKYVLATDFSPAMLTYNLSNSEANGLSNICYEVMDGQDLKVADNTFDRAISSFGIMLFPDRHKGFTELYRVLKPKGKVVVSGWSDPSKFEGFNLFLRALKKAFPDLPTPQDPPVFSLSDLSILKAEMENVGFKQVEVKYITRELNVSGVKEMWEMFTVGAPPIKLLMDKIGDKGKKQLFSALVDIVSKEFGNGPIKLNNAATVGVGVKE